MKLPHPINRIFFVLIVIPFTFISVPSNIFNISITTFDPATSAVSLSDECERFLSISSNTITAFSILSKFLSHLTIKSLNISSTDLPTYPEEVNADVS